MRVVLAHGFAGFVQVPTIGQYYGGVKQHLETKFADIEVLEPRVDPMGTTSERAHQLSRQLPEDGVKAHIIAHSAAGLDARFLVAAKGAKRWASVETVTTISTPHHGSIIAELLTRTNPAVAALLPYLTQFAAVVGSFTQTFMAKFNETIKDHPDVRYYSYAGISGLAKRGFLEPAFAASYPLLLANEGANDGWVAVTSAIWGTFKDEIDADHLEQVGMSLSPIGGVLDQVGLKAFNHLDFYEHIVADLGGVRKA